MVWRSYKIRRGVGSTLAGEAQVLSGGLGHLEWMACFFAAAVFPTFLLEDRTEYMRLFGMQAVIDCKSVFDHITKPGSPGGVEDKRCAIDMSIIRQSLARLVCALRWAPTALQLADGLTKDSAEPLDLLRACLRHGVYQLASEASVLAEALQERIRRKERKAAIVGSPTS